MKITSFCFLMEMFGIGITGIQYLLGGGITPGVTISIGFILSACIVYTYARWQEVNE